MAIAEGTIQLRRGTAAYFTSNNPTLSAGEPGWESDTNKFKVGDGSTVWNNLTYFYEADIDVIDGGVEPTYLAGFAASAYGTVQLWVKADDGITHDTSGRITDWEDFGQNNYHFGIPVLGVNNSLIVTDNTKNSLPEVIGNGTALTMSVCAASITMTQPATIFLVGRMRQPDANGRYWFDGMNILGTSDRWIIGTEFNGAGTVGVWAGVQTVGLCVTYTSFEYGIWVATLSGATSSIREYTGTPATGDAGDYAFSNAGFSIGLPVLGGQAMEGGINELLIYEDILSEATIGIIINYLNSKWDVY